jgi:hypothetical protein
LTAGHGLDYHFTMTADELRWQLADLQTSPPVATPELVRRPRVELRGDRLVWWMIYGTGEGSSGGSIKPPRDLLERFTRLADAPDQDIAAFASRFGVLGICEHGAPASHSPGCRPLRCDREGGGQDYYAWEPISAWRHYSGQTRAALNVAACLHDGKAGTAEDWQRIYARTTIALAGEPVPWWPRDRHDSFLLAGERFMLGQVLNELLHIAGVSPVVEWHRPKPQIVLSGGGLFGQVVVRLAMAVVRTSGLAICSGCGAAYSPERRPAPGRRTYCLTCRERGIPQRDAQRAYRAGESKRRRKTANAKRTPRKP